MLYSGPQKALLFHIFHSIHSLSALLQHHQCYFQAKIYTYTERPNATFKADAIENIIIF